ncbi:transcriptional regulator NrdR [Alicyclobacillus tolerans]|uniref:Transcriptional repressor NrdR n=2 Tax=Alicyclobacillus tolerans TaxID=90970 RepID=A0ABT9LVI7_9BACL|nr:MULTISPECIES: transcriptional regulator NrdR [Alicyclobacillus]MDP9728247.1 transcriptional repressor NrdR [Alicyclobacillus tengchongensis]QRF23459.1 transcriptional repressor NrdR [Alicyclobacillus sp. TC]SHJ81425.1 transcriptional repressor NrdR [Alicyclobacillus montanus]
MRCPFCGSENSRVIESRSSEEDSATRRRRECVNVECSKRFTTWERVELRPLVVVKKDKMREEFDRDKLYRGLQRACEKRPISADKLDEVVTHIEQSLRAEYEREVPSSAIGERVMEELRSIDGVAYVRFASVYRQFRDVETFAKEVLALMEKNVT